jgi:CBS domain-containing protein
MARHDSDHGPGARRPGPRRRPFDRDAGPPPGPDAERYSGPPEGPWAGEGGPRPGAGMGRRLLRGYDAGYDWPAAQPPPPPRARPEGRPGPRAEAYGRRRRWAGDADVVRACDIMTLDPECVTPDTPLADVAVRMRELDIGIVPVVDSEDRRRLCGVVTDRDIVVRALASGRDGACPVSECMTHRVGTVPQGATVHDVLNVMKRDRVRRVPVTDDDGRLVGIVAQADLAVAYAGLDRRREAEVEEALERISEPAGLDRRVAGRAPRGRMR